MIVPTPHCSPWRAGLGANSSSAWLNLCSEPLAGRDDPAMLIATPLATRAFITVQADSSRPGFINSAESISILAVRFEIMDAYSLNGSSCSLCASSQSFTAVQLDMMSPHPAARSRYGAAAIIDVFLTTSSKVLDDFETFLFSRIIEALDE